MSETEVRMALERAGLAARAFATVTTIRFPSFRRATYRVDLESGETIKARCLEDEAAARRLFEVRRHLPDAFVPAFACHGPVLLERWVPGRVLGHEPPGEALLGEAAVLLARLHGTPGGSPEGASDRDTGAWRRKTEEGLRTLASARALDPRDADRAARDLERGDPGQVVLVLGHFDFCGENMVVDASGRLRVVDNERIGIGPLGFDLARTWYRWGLSGRDWAFFERAYVATSGHAEPLAHLDFWRLVVLVQSACLRLDAPGQALSVPLDRLKGLAAETGDA